MVQRNKKNHSCITSTTNKIVPTSHQSLLRIRLNVVTSAGRGPVMCASPLLSRKTPVSPKLQLSVGRFSALVVSLWARTLRGCGAAAAQSENFCHKCQTYLRNKDSNSWRHLQLHPLAAGRLAADPATGVWVQVTSAAWADQAGAGGREKNAGCGWRANAPPRAVSEAPAERRRGCARLAPGAERRASPRQQTGSCQPTNLTKEFG